MDLSKLTYDQMNFEEERKAKGAAFKYTTYKGWLFGKAWKCYDESTGKVNLPERLNTVGQIVGKKTIGQKLSKIKEN